MSTLEVAKQTPRELCRLITAIIAICIFFETQLALLADEAMY